MLYVARKQDTASPLVVSTDPSSLLIRCLRSKKVKAPSDAGAGTEKGTQPEEAATVKRKAPTVAEGEQKKKVYSKGASGSGAGASIQRTVYSRETLLQMQVVRLKGILQEKKLPVGGKKADLVERILDHQ